MSKQRAMVSAHSSAPRRIAAWLLCSTALTLLGPNAANANPLNGQVAAGSATITQSGSNRVNINQQSQKAVINWQSFSIGSGETTNFNQPSASAITLNRVTGVDPSSIVGNLTANGQIWLINPNGIAFGKSARVDVAGLLATTIDIADQDFMAGNYRFTGLQNPGTMVTNAGLITVHDAGLAALVAPGVENSGVIQANLGQIQLSSTAAFTVDLYGDGLFNFTLGKQVTQAIAKPDGTKPSAAVTNTGKLIADGGRILLTANAASSVVSHSINMDGYAQATTAKVTNGEIVLDGGSDGTVEVAGTLDASGQQGMNGGTIKVLADKTNGTVVVSGTLDASAPNGGNGGFIETSAAHVKVSNAAKITTSAPSGMTGTWLVDPRDYTVASAGGDITGGALTSQLASTNITINSSSGAAGTSGDVNVNDTVHWSANTLTLNAANNVNINGVMSATGTASLALNPAIANGSDVAISTGSIVVGRDTSGNFVGRIDFSGAGTLSISGTPYIVINSLGSAGDLSTATLQGMKNNLGGNYVLGSNIDASSTASWNGGAGFASIGASTSQFTGVLDGLGHAITGLTIKDTADQDIGLFGYVSSGGNVANLTLNDPSVASGGTPSSASWSRGVLAGQNFGTIENVVVTNPDSGLVGNNFGVISDVGVTGLQIALPTNGGLAVGGIAAVNGGTISHSSVSGTITSLDVVPSDGLTGLDDLIGGLVGNNEGSSGEIADSWSTVFLDIGTVSQSDVGGLVGWSGGTIQSSYATGQVVSGNGPLGCDPAFCGTSSDAGGLVGTNAGEIRDSYSTGMVSAGGHSDVGGLAGSNSGTIIQSHANGSVTGSATTENGDNVGGLVGLVSDGSGSISDSYATGNVVGGTYSNIGGFAGSLSGISVSSSYATGSVTGGDASDVGGFVGSSSATISSSHAMGNVTGTDYSYNDSVSVTDFSGSFDVGGFMGANDGNVAYSYATGNVSGGEWTGGFVGLNDEAWLSVATISQSYSTGSVTNHASIMASGAALWLAVGGFAGENDGALDSVYATGNVLGSTRSAIGGLVGTLGPGTVTSSYSIGSVQGDASSTVGGLVGISDGDPLGTVVNSYWDVDTSTQSGSAGGTGLTTTQLKSGLPGGFDTAVWAQEADVNGGYPYLLNNAPTVSLIPLSWSVADVTSTYGTLATLGTVSFSGLLPADMGLVLPTIELFRGNTSVTLSSTLAAGTYTEEVVGITGSAASRYTLSATGDILGTLTVNPKTLTWSVADTKSTFGTTPVPGLAFLIGKVGSDDVNGLVGITTSNSDVFLSPTTPVGSYFESVIGLTGTDAKNYVLAPSGNILGTLTVEQPSQFSSVAAQTTNPILPRGATGGPTLGNLFAEAGQLMGTGTHLMIYDPSGGQGDTNPQNSALFLDLISLLNPEPYKIDEYGFISPTFYTTMYQEQCVALVAALSSVGGETGVWKPVMKVTADDLGSIPFGTPIGTFDQADTYTSAHSAIFLGAATLNGVSGFYILDQYNLSETEQQPIGASEQDRENLAIYAPAEIRFYKASNLSTLSSQEGAYFTIGLSTQTVASSGG